MRLNKFTTFMLAAGLATILAVPASAQGSFNFGFGKFGSHSGWGIGFSTPIYYHSPSYYYPRHYYYEPYYYDQRPVVVEQRTWVPGYWETREQQVWVPGVRRREWIEPQHEVTRDPAGNETRVLVEGHWKIIEEPGRYETRSVQVWVPGRYV